MERISDENIGLLVSNNRHHPHHTYGIDSSSMFVENQTASNEKACRLCCLFAMHCTHIFPSVSSSNQSKELLRNENKQTNTELPINIWKEELDQISTCSPLFDVPRCFHENLTNQKRETSSTFASIWMQDESNRSIESLLKLLPSPPNEISSMNIENNDHINNKGKNSTVKEKTRENSFYSIPKQSATIISQKIDYAEVQSANVSNFQTENKKRKLMKNTKDSFETAINHLQKKSQHQQNRFPIAISQFVQDIHTRAEVNIEASRAMKVKRLSPPLSDKIQCARCGYQSNISSINGLHDSHHCTSKKIPTVPNCLNELSQFNDNATSIRSKRYRERLDDHDQLNSSERIMNNSGRSSSLLRNNKKLFTSLSAQSTQAQQERTPTNDCSLNVNLSLDSSSLVRNQRKTPYNRDLFDPFESNHYSIVLFIEEYHGEKFIFLEKNSSGRWQLPIMHTLEGTLKYETLNIADIDHALNADNVHLEIKLILIKNSQRFLSMAHWFSVRSLSTFDDIQEFDRNLIKYFLSE